jgi:hypothetical protein
MIRPCPDAVEVEVVDCMPYSLIAIAKHKHPSQITGTTTAKALHPYHLANFFILVARLTEKRIGKVFMEALSSKV